MTTFTDGSLFSGIGGFDYGFKLAGFTNRWQCELEKPQRSVLARHFPESKRYVDVREMDGTTAEPVDVMTFGSPCQDLSIAGKRKGLEGERSGLFYEAIRIVDQRRPAFAIWENVVGSLSSNSGRDFAAVLAAFRDIGALDIGYRVLDAQHFGVPQRRRRVLLVADFRGKRAGEILFKPDSSAWHFETRRKAGKDVAASAQGSVGNYRIVRSDDYTTDSTASTLAARDYKSATDLIVTNTLTTEEGLRGSCGDGNDNLVIGTLAASGAGTSRPAGQGNELDFLIRDTPPINHRRFFDAQTGEWCFIDKDGRKFTIDPSLAPIAKTITSNYGKQPDNSNSSTPGNFVVDAIAFDRTKAQWDTERAGTLRAGGGVTEGVNDGKADHWCTLQASAVRRLTPRECERLQGFDDDWTAYGANGEPMSDSVRYRMLGNAVAVPVAYWLALRIREALETQS